MHNSPIKPTLCIACSGVFSESAIWDDSGDWRLLLQSLNLMQRYSDEGCQLSRLAVTSWGHKAFQRVQRLSRWHAAVADKNSRVTLQPWIFEIPQRSYTLRFLDQWYPEDPYTEYDDDDEFCLWSAKVSPLQGTPNPQWTVVIRADRCRYKKHLQSQKYIHGLRWMHSTNPWLGFWTWSGSCKV